MISYYHHRKDKGTLWTCEDSLTSTLFDNLKHLPSDLIWEILKNGLKEGHLPPHSGELLSISFWDKWKPTDTTNTNFVEPDVFLRFENLDLIVEAKRYDSFQQKDDQINNEIIGYFNEYGSEEKALYFLQLGGLQDGDSYLDKIKEEHKGKFKMCKTNWTTILEHIVKKYEIFQIYDDKFSKSYCHILEDIIHGFELHQFYKKRWLKDLVNLEINTDNFDHFSYLKNMPHIKSLLLIPQIKINITNFSYFQYGK